MDTRTKILSFQGVTSGAVQICTGIRRLVVAAGGFDVLQAAHARFLAGLRDSDSVLLVAVWNDLTLSRLSGRPTPVLGQDARALMVAALAAVDYVVVCSEAELESLAAGLSPARLERSIPGERNIIEEVRARHEPRR